MKLMKKTGIYKASNVTFDPKFLEAHSYGWWKFVSLINGKLVFNNYRYSNTTALHQFKTRQLLQSLGHKIDLTIETPRGLDSLNSGIEHYKYLIFDLETQMKKPRSQKAKNQERQQMIAEYQNKIQQIQELIGV